MFNAAVPLIPLAAFALALGWALLQPGTLASVLALGCAGLLAWATERRVARLRSAASARVAASEQRCAEQARALAEAEAARARAEADRRAAEERSGLALRGSQDGLWEWDVGSGAVHLSPRWKSMLGFESGE